MRICLIITGSDLLSLAATAKDINDNGLNWSNGLGLVADVGSLVLPGVAGGGTLVRNADEVYAAGKAGVNKVMDLGKWAFGYGDDVGDAARKIDNIPCNSFSAETVVLTEDGTKPISELKEGDRVYAWNEATQQIELQPIIDTISHHDLSIVVLTLAFPEHVEGGETLETTAEHPFAVLEGSEWMPLQRKLRWVDASQLQVGDAVLQADGETGRVVRVQVVDDPQRMYNLTVDTAHTFFVGSERWLVHNAGPCNLNFNLSGSGDHLRSQINYLDQNFQFNRGHGFDRAHSGPMKLTDLRSTGLTPDTIETSIVYDIDAFLKNGGGIQAAGKGFVERIVVIDSFSIGYRAVKLKDGTISISTYFLTQ